MSVDLIRYDLLVQDALRDVVRRVLTDAARDGLPGEHHFFIGFNTQAPGVRLSARLKERHPKTMTIVLQHQFWDLLVTDKFLEVGLSFGNVPERLHIPFEALTSFYDPSVKFGLQFEPPAGEEDEETGEEEAVPPPPAALERRTRTTSVPPTSTAPRPLRPVEPASKPVTARPAAVKPVEAKPAEPKSPEAKPAAETRPTEPKPTERKAAEPASKAGGKEASAKETPAKEAAPKEPTSREAGSKEAGSKEAGSKETPAKDETSGGAQVVRLDAFRKK